MSYSFLWLLHGADTMTSFVGDLQEGTSDPGPSPGASEPRDRWGPVAYLEAPF